MDTIARLELADDCLEHALTYLTESGQVQPGHEHQVCLWANAGLDLLLKADWTVQAVNEYARDLLKVLATLPLAFAA